MHQRSLRQARVSVSLIFLIHGLIIESWGDRHSRHQDCISSLRLLGGH
jgi:hypothetical protein